MAAAIRNLGRPGIASMAISGVDSALWDLKARLLDLPLVTLLGAVHEAVPVYGSGGFTSYTNEQLQKQLAGWVNSGIGRVKMKIGRDRAADLRGSGRPPGDRRPGRALSWTPTVPIPASRPWEGPVRRPGCDLVRGTCLVG